MSAINEIQDEIIEEFELFDNWMDKYEQIIDMGNNLPPLTEEHKVKRNLVKGCVAQVWLHTRHDNGHVIFEADSDAQITKGLIAMLVRVFSGRFPQEIVDNDLYFVERIGLKEHLSPNRANGLVAMIKRMKLDALALTVKT